MDVFIILPKYLVAQILPSSKASNQLTKSYTKCLMLETAGFVIPKKRQMFYRISVCATLHSEGMEEAVVMPGERDMFRVNEKLKLSLSSIVFELIISEDIQFES